MSYWKMFLSDDESSGSGADAPTPEPSTHEDYGTQAPRAPQAPSDVPPVSAEDTPAPMPPDEPSTITKGMGASNTEDSE